MSEEMVTEATDNVEQAPVESSGNQDWREALSEELRAEPTLANINDLESAAKTLVHQQKMLGARIPLPKNEEEMNELYGKLGRPETPDGYEISAPQGFEQYYTDDSINAFKETGHKLGLTPQQMQGLVEWQQQAIQSSVEADVMRGEAMGVETEEMLRKEFGANYEKNLTAAQRALRVYGNETLQQKLADPRYGNDPDLIRLLANAGKDITEDSAQGTTNNSLVMSPLDAKMKIDQINANKSHPYWNPTDPKHADAQNEMAQLFDKANNS